MVGVEMVIFFLLLLSLAEHVPFGVSYGVASVACAVASAFYLRHVLGGRKRGLGFGVMQGGLYATLFVLLQAEEYALLLGSTFLFAVVCLAMVLTRKVDWFAIGQRRETTDIGRVKKTFVRESYRIPVN
jgi:inner membrane protein